jgi:hypothetical protein
MPPIPYPGDEQAPGARAELELLGSDEDEHEADRGEAEVAEHRLRRQQGDPAVQERAERGAPVRVGLTLRRSQRLASKRQHDRDDRDQHERQPPGDLAEQPAEDRGEHEAGGLRRRERADRPAEHVRRHDLGERRQEDGERKAFALPMAARAARKVQMSGARAQASAARPKAT